MEKFKRFENLLTTTPATTTTFVAVGDPFPDPKKLKQALHHP